MKAGLKAAAAASAWVLFITCLLITKHADGGVPAFSAVITEKTEVSGSENITFDISMPVISGLGDKAFENALNESIDRQISGARDAAVRDADEHWQHMNEEGFEPWPYAFFAEYEVKSNKGIISLKVTTFLYTGGPGMPYSVCYNADLEKSTLITLGELFKDGTYKERINSIILGEMAEDADVYVPAGEFAGVSDETQFFISGGGLFITFAKYAVASGAAGEPEFLIPTEEIRGMLKEEYKGIFE